MHVTRVLAKAATYGDWALVKNMDLHSIFQLQIDLHPWFYHDLILTWPDP